MSNNKLTLRIEIYIHLITKNNIILLKYNILSVKYFNNIKQLQVLSLCPTYFI